MMLNSELATAIMNSVDAGFDEQVALTAELVKFPSVRGAEHTAQDFVASALRERGLAVDRWRIDIDAIRHMPGFSPVHVEYDNAFNCGGSHGPRSAKGRSLILNGHIDVVPVGPLDMWTTPPFAPRIEDGWLYGRGGGDMKAGLAGSPAGIHALARLGHCPAADLHIPSVLGEECTGNRALAHLPRRHPPHAAVHPQPMREQPSHS